MTRVLTMTVDAPFLAYLRRTRPLLMASPGAPRRGEQLELRHWPYANRPGRYAVVLPGRPLETPEIDRQLDTDAVMLVFEESEYKEAILYE